MEVTIFGRNGSGGHNMADPTETPMHYADRLDQYIAEGRLIRGAWTREEDGRQLACLLAAMSPEVAAAERADACPARIMPPWLAHLTPWIDDAGTKAHWPAVLRRYAGLVRRWHLLDAEGWRRADMRARLAALAEAEQHTTDAEALDAIAGMRALLLRVIAGDEPTRDEWAAAWATAAAWAAAAVAAWAAERKAADRIIDAILDGLEAEIAAAEVDRG